MKKIVFRMDDVGASTKKFEIYSKKPFGNFLFLKRMPYFKAWGPYNELSTDNWKDIFNFIGENNYKLSLAITAAWVDEKNNLIPFYEKFPDQAKVICEFLKKGILEINNHGLTHCVVGKHNPRLFSSNRKYHREFWEWVPYKTQYFNLSKSSEIFKKWLGYSPNILVPPGNVYSNHTIKICEALNFKIINSSRILDIKTNVRILNNDNVFAFHDRDIVLNGSAWLKKIYKNYANQHQFNFIEEL
jgi:hypothetical protein